MIPVIKRHEVQVLLSAGHSHRKVAKLADVSTRTVTRISQEPKLEGLDEIWVAQNRDDLLAQLTEWLQEANDECPSRATGQIPAVRLIEEQKRLRPLVVPSEGYALPFDILVGPTGMVAYKGVRYAMPPVAISFSGKLYVYPDRIRITAGTHEVLHPRLPQRKLSYPPELRGQHLAAVSGERGRLYFQRERLLVAQSWGVQRIWGTSSLPHPKSSP